MRLQCMLIMHWTAINFHIKAGGTTTKSTKEVPPVVKAEQVTNPTINKSLRVNRTNNGNTVWVTNSDESIALNNKNSHIDVKDFNLPIGSALYIEKKSLSRNCNCCTR